MQRTDLQDTTPEFHLEYVRLMRLKSVLWKINRVIELSEMSMRAFPEQTKRAVRLKMKNRS